MFILITPENSVPHEIETIIRLFEEGLETLHLRKPEADMQQMKEYLDQIPKQYHKHIVVHSHYDLIDKYNLKGIHITAKTKEQFDILTDPNPDPGSLMFINAFKQMLERKTVSISCHSIGEIEELKYSFDYAFLSPVFDSISKKGYISNFVLEDLQKDLSSIINKVVALGGINKANSALCKEIGFNGIAVLGAVWEEETIENRISAFKELI